MPAPSRILLACTFASLLTACDRGPTADAIKGDLAAYIDSNTVPGLLEVADAQRLDHRTLPDMRSAPREIDYAATLRLKRDYDFGAWEQANAAALTLLLGAKPETVGGLEAAGNRAGDTLAVRGTLVYGKSDEHWRLLSSAPPPPAPPRPADDRLSLLTSWTQLTGATMRALFASPGPLPGELALSRKQLEARVARKNGRAAIASGASGSDPWKVIDGTSHAAAPSSVLVNVATAGARENLQLLRSGAVSAIILRGDEAALAALGQGPFEEDGSFPAMRAVASLYPEQVHVVVKGTSSIASVADLFGKRVVVAASGPTARRQADDILRAHRVVLAGDALVEQELPAALAALQKGERDALVLTASAPSADLRRYAVTDPLRFLALDADAVALLTTGTSNYVAVTLPGQVYPGQSRSVASVGVAAQLISATTVSGAEVDYLLGKVFGARDAMAGGSPLGVMVRRSTSQRWLTLPLHSGAEAFYGLFDAPK